MDSPFALIYSALVKRLKLVDGLKHINMDFGQLDDEGRPDLVFPAALIEFGNFQFTNLGQLGQAAEGSIIVRLVVPRLGSVSSLAPDTVRDNALEFLDLTWAVNRALHGWEPTAFCSALIRTAESTRNVPRRAKVRNMQYTVRIEDWSAERDTVLTPKPPMEADI